MFAVVLLKSVMGTPEIDDGKSAGCLEQKNIDEKNLLTNTLPYPPSPEAKKRGFFSSFYHGDEIL